MDHHTNAPDLRDYLAVLKARRWGLASVAIMVVGAALAYSYAQTPMFTAEAKVLIETPTFVTSGAVPPPVNVETQRQLAGSEPVAALVADDLGLEDMAVDSLLDGLEIDAVMETEVLEFSYSSRTALFAQNAANSFAESYIEFRRERALQSVVTEQTAIEGRVDAATGQLTEVTDQLDRARRDGDQALTATLETSRNVLMAKLGVLQERLDDAQANESSELAGGLVIEEAAIPNTPSSPNHVTDAVLGVLLGLAFGVGFAFMRERLDDRFRQRTEVEQVIDVPVLATVPRFKVKKRGHLIAAEEPMGMSSESYRNLRTNLQFIASQRGMKTILVTSPAASEGKTVTTANLAVVLAQAGSRVIVVSADLRRPTVEMYFGLDPSPHDEGFSTLLMSRGGDPWKPMRDPGMPNIRVLPAGPVPPNPTELLSSDNLTELIKTLEANCDIVLFDSPPVLAVADAAILASRVSGSLLVIDAKKTRRRATMHAKEEIERVGGHLIGSVLNSFNPQWSSYYYGAYHYSSVNGGGGSRLNGGRDGSRLRSRLTVGR